MYHHRYRSDYVLVLQSLYHLNEGVGDRAAAWRSVPRAVEVKIRKDVLFVDASEEFVKGTNRAGSPKRISVGAFCTMEPVAIPAQCVIKLFAVKRDSLMGTLASL